MKSLLLALWQVLKPTNPAEFWTLVTGVGTFALVVVAYRGLRSLGLTKADMKTRATRDSRAAAIERCEEFAERIVILNAEILVSFAQNKVPVFVKSAAEVRFDPDNEEDLKSARDWWSKIPVDAAVKCIKLLNEVEAWAMYFTNQLADSKVAFGPCAPAYCSMVVQLYAALLVFRASPSSGKYPNAVQLYKGWMDMLEEEKRGLKRGDLLKQLGALQSKGPSGTRLPEPLGLEANERNR